MKKRLSMFLVCVLLLCACSSQQTKYQEQYDLGIKYLSEGNYEEAIIAFKQAIEIDAKQAAAYVGCGDSYVGLAGQVINDEQREAYYNKAAEDYQKAIDLGDKASVEKLQKVQLLMSSQEYLKALYASFAADGLAAMQEVVYKTDTSVKVELTTTQKLLVQETYKQLAKSIDEGYLYYARDGEYGLAIYPNEYCYFGQWENGKRSGKGILVVESWFNKESGVYTESHYQGEWLNDKPHGEGVNMLIHISDRYYSENDYLLKKDHLEDLIDCDSYSRSEFHGTFADGKGMSTMQKSHEYWMWYSDELGTDQVSTQTEIDFVDGIANGRCHHTILSKWASDHGEVRLEEYWGEFKDGYLDGKVQFRETIDGNVRREEQQTWRFEEQVMCRAYGFYDTESE